jgi:glycogen debranching enzyme
MGLTELTDPGLRLSMRRLFEAYDGLWTDPPALLARGAFTWVDCLVNACYLQAQESEAHLLELAGRAEEAATVRERRARGRAALLARCWDDSAGLFFDYYLATEGSADSPGGAARRPVAQATITSLLPLILHDLPPPLVDRLVREHLANPGEFWLPYGLPSVPVSEPSFEPDFRCGLIWRGPTWVNTNWFLVHALRRHGYRLLAAELVERTVEMLARSGLRECFNPYTAEGYGARDFGWSALVLDLLEP